jgi:hypothetical protein
VITACFHGGPWDGLQFKHTVAYEHYCFQAHRPKGSDELPQMGMQGPILPNGVEAEFYRPVQAIGAQVCYAHVGRRWMQNGAPK